MKELWKGENYISEIMINQHYEEFNPVHFGYENCKPSHHFGPCVRDFWLLHYVVSGKGVLIKNNKNYVVTAGNIFIIPPYIETYYEADAKDPWNYIFVGFESKNIPSEFKKTVIHCPAAETIFEDMKKSFKMNNGKNAYLVGKLWELYSTLIDDRDETNNYVERAILFIKAQYMNNISVNQIADFLNLNRSYFSQIFKKEMGISPQAYLSNYRLSKAAELMTKHHLSPTTVASSVGYSDLYTFSKMFKQRYGISPRSYIKNYTSVATMAPTLEKEEMLMKN